MHHTTEEKYVADYINDSMKNVLKLNCFEFWFLLREATIYRWSQTESGREYLESCYAYEQTDADMEGLEAFKKSMQKGV